MMELSRHVLPPLLVVGLCGVVLTSWACTSAATVAPPPPLNGAALEPRVDLPRLTFTRSDGGTFATTETQGRTSLFFFGYTHCADVCPLTLAQFVQMRRSLGPDADKVDMYFVTLDPVRDTPERMKVYLTNFPGIVGLVGSDNELASAQSAFSVVAERHDTGNDEYAVDHTAATYLVNSASQIQLVYPYGTASDEIVVDLRRLVAVAPPVGPTVTQARARPADVGGTTAIYLRIQNDSDSGDRLVGVASPIGSAEMHTSIDDGGIMRMRSTEAVDLPSRGEVRFEPGGLHIMVSELQQTLVAGDEITLTLHFERVGQLQVQVPVVS